MTETVANWSNEDNVFVLRKPKWHEHALCYGVSGDVFFEEGVRRLVIEAKTYCNRCPVRIHCLEHALANEEIGIWGGLTTKERTKEASRRRRLKRHGASK